MKMSNPRAWRQVCYWVLDGTRLRVEQEAAGSFIVVDRFEPDRKLAAALKPGRARQEAERLAETGDYDLSK